LEEHWDQQAFNMDPGNLTLRWRYLRKSGLAYLSKTEEKVPRGRAPKLGLQL